MVFSVVCVVLDRNRLHLSLCFIFSHFFLARFVGQTIFVTDYEANQKVVRDTQLYDSVFVARLFHNKGRVFFDKFTFNLFALTDPSNYFFGFHPRQVATNQNLIKFPFLYFYAVQFSFYVLNILFYINFLLPLFSLSGLTVLK
jgi:hypothetical protein